MPTCAQFRALRVQAKKGAPMLKLAMLGKDDKGNYRITDPRPGHAVESFAAKDVDKAITRWNEVNAEIGAEFEAAQPKSEVIEILSKDGGLVCGIQTRKANDTVVFVQKPTARNKLTAEKSVTELGLCEVTGFVLVSRDHGGKVRSEYAGGKDVPRPVPMTPAGIAALQAIMAGGRASDALEA